MLACVACYYLSFIASVRMFQNGCTVLYLSEYKKWIDAKILLHSLHVDRVTFQCENDNRKI